MFLLMFHCDETHYNMFDVMQYHHNGIFFISPFICLQWGYDVIIPLLQILGFCFGFGGEGEEGGCFGVD